MSFGAAAAVAADVGGNAHYVVVAVDCVAAAAAAAAVVAEHVVHDGSSFVLSDSTSAVNRTCKDTDFPVSRE